MVAHSYRVIPSSDSVLINHVKKVLLPQTDRAMRYVSQNLANCYTSNTTQHDTRRYFNVRSKADISQLNSPHGTKLKKWKREKLKSEKNGCSDVSVNSPRGIRGFSPEEKRKVTVVRFCRKGKLWAWNERVKGWRLMKVVSRWNRWKKCHS